MRPRLDGQGPRGRGRRPGAGWMRIAAFLAIAAIGAVGASALFLFGPHGSETSPGAAERSERARLRQRVAALEAENALLRESALACRDDTGGSPDPLPTGNTRAAERPGFRAGGAVPGDAFLTLRDALAREDRRGFVEAFLALLATGESAYPDLMAFFEEMELYELDRIAREILAPDGSDPSWLGSVEGGSAQVSAFLDAILRRGAVIDKATIVALRMMNEFPLQSSIPVEERTQLLLDLATGAAGSGDAELADGILSFAADELARLEATEALPALEGIVADEGGSFRSLSILRAIASMDSPEAMASLERVLAEAEDGRLEALIVASLETETGSDSNRLLWAMFEQPKGRIDRTQISHALALRPENWESLIELIESGPISVEERQMIATTIAESGSQQASASLWKAYSRMRDEGARGDVLVGLAVSGDDDALGIATQALLADEAPDQFSLIFESLNAKRARSIEAELAQVAADASNSSRLRFGAASALATIDRAGAVAALVNGFEGLAAAERVKVVRSLGGMRLGGASAQAALERIAVSDPSPTVRETAARRLN
jgi:hypothetical protein